MRSGPLGSLARRGRVAALTLLLAWVLVSCGAGTGARAVPVARRTAPPSHELVLARGKQSTPRDPNTASSPSPTSPAPTPMSPAPTPMSPAPTPMSPAQRAALQPALARYGSGWWLTNLEQGYVLAVVETPTEHTIELTARGASGVRAVVHVQRDGQLRHEPPDAPQGPELTPAEVALAERIVVATGTAWLNPYEGHTTVLDLSRGLSALLGDTPRRSRRRGSAAVFYTRPDPEGPLLAVVVDLERAQLLEVTSHEVPPIANGLVPPADIAAIDEAMRRHGDFGVYGDVTPGLVAMRRDFGLTVRPSQTAGRYEVTVSPRDGNGHTLTFHVDVATRSLGGMTAEHSVSLEKCWPGDVKPGA